MWELTSSFLDVWRERRKITLGPLRYQYSGARIVTTTYDCCRQRGVGFVPLLVAVAMLIGQDRKPPRDYARDRGVGLVNRSQGFFSDVTSITGGIVLKGPGQIPTFA